MARTGPGQAVHQAWQGFKDRNLLAVGVLNEIGDQQADYIRASNVKQMEKGLNRNGESLGSYKPGTVRQRKALGLRTGKVDLKRSGNFHGSIRGVSTRSKVERGGTATIEFEVTVPKRFAGRIEGFRTGRYGKHGRNIERPVLGMADRGTALRTAQEKALKTIALKVYKRELAGADVRFTSTDF